MGSPIFKNSNEVKWLNSKIQVEVIISLLYLADEIL